MKKKLVVLLMGAFLAATPFVSNATLTAGQTVTVNGVLYRVVVEPDPVDGGSTSSETEVQEAYAEFYVRSHPADFDGGFALVNGEDALTLQQVPFDLGIGTLLGAGAIAAARKARRRRKQAAVEA